MWGGVVLLVAVVVEPCNLEYNDYYHQDTDENPGRDLYDFYGEVHTVATMMMDSTLNRSFTRIRRFGEESSSFSTHADMRYIKGALKEILAGHDIESVHEDPADVIDLDESVDDLTLRWMVEDRDQRHRQQ
ncbi:hypothetical protein SFRURICE_016061 [Spodoptera frugiperda]|nr:hypothetical protein SFRURICE_016061 [Spodoptera frugiperda]